MSEPPRPGFRRYTVTYCQEVVQLVDAPDIASAGQFAKNAAARVKGAHVLSVYAGEFPALPAPGEA